MYRLRTRMIRSAGSAPNASEARHSQSGWAAGTTASRAKTRKKHSEEAAYHVGHHAAARLALLPFPLSFENSDRNAMATGRSIPTPKPIAKRARIRMVAVGAMPATRAAMTKQIISAMKTAYRPIRSVSHPPAMLPTIVPALIAAATMPVADVVRPKCFCTSPMP